MNKLDITIHIPLIDYYLRVSFSCDLSLSQNVTLLLAHLREKEEIYLEYEPIYYVDSHSFVLLDGHMTLSKLNGYNDMTISLY